MINTRSFKLNTKKKRVLKMLIAHKSYFLSYKVNTQCQKPSVYVHFGRLMMTMQHWYIRLIYSVGWRCDIFSLATIYHMAVWPVYLPKTHSYKLPHDVYTQLNFLFFFFFSLRLKMMLYTTNLYYKFIKLLPCSVSICLFFHIFFFFSFFIKI